MTRRAIRSSFSGALVLTVLLAGLSFQNCSSANFQGLTSIKAANSNQASQNPEQEGEGGSNGGSYDGIGNYTSHVGRGNTCPDGSKIRDRVSVSKTVVSASRVDCQEISERRLDPGEYFFSMKRKILVFQNRVLNQISVSESEITAFLCVADTSGIETEIKLSSAYGFEMLSSNMPSSVPASRTLPLPPTYVDSYRSQANPNLGIDVLTRQLDGRYRGAIKLENGSSKDAFCYRGLTSDAPTAIDPFAANVIFLSHMEGTNGSVHITNEKGPTPEVKGSVRVSTEVSKFGDSSLALDVNVDSAVSIPYRVSSTPLTLGNGAFAIEFFVNFRSHERVDNTLVSVRRSTYSDTVGPPVLSFKLAYGGKNNGSKTHHLYAINHTGNELVSSVEWLPVDGVWYHIAVTRSGSEYRFFVDGIQLGNVVDGSDSDAGGMFFNIGDLLIGPSSIGAGDGADAYMDELRVTAGVPRYLNSFAVPTGPYR